MNGKKLLITLAASVVLCAGCGLKSHEAIIKVNDTSITQSDFDKAFDKQAGAGMLGQLGVNIKDDKNGFMYLLIKQRVTNELIIKALLEQEIAKRGIKVTDEDVENAIKDIITKVGSKEQLNALLKQNGISSKDFKQDLAQEVKMKKLAESLGSSKVTDMEAKKFYKDNIDKFKHPQRVRASHILISANPVEIEEIVKSSPENKNISKDKLSAKVSEELKAKEAKAQKLLAQIKANPADFAKLAKDNSDDTTTAVKGGDLGFFAEKEMVPEFSKAAFSTKPDSVVDHVVKTQYGYHIIMVTDRAEAVTDSYDNVKNDIKAYLENQKQLELLDKLTESLKKNAKIEYLNAEYSPDAMKNSLQKSIEESSKKSQETEKNNKQK